MNLTERFAALTPEQREKFYTVSDSAELDACFYPKKARRFPKRKTQLVTESETSPIKNFSRGA